MRASRLGLRQLDGNRFRSPAALLLCHGALLQPNVLCRVFPRRSDRPLPRRSPERFAFFGGVPDKILIDNPELQCSSILPEKGRSFTRGTWTLQHTTASSHVLVMCEGQTKKAVWNPVSGTKEELPRRPATASRLEHTEHCGPPLDRYGSQYPNSQGNTQTTQRTLRAGKAAFERVAATSPPIPESSGLYRPAAASVWCWIPTRYSVPSLYASQSLLLKTFADRLCIYHGEKLIASQPQLRPAPGLRRSEHGKELLDQRRTAREAKLLLRFYGLCPRAEEYYVQLKFRRLNPRQHIAKILALSEVHGCDKIARAIQDSFEFQAFSSDYIANILQQRERFSPQPGPLHLTRRQDLLEVELEQPDLSVYEGSDTIPIVPKP